MGIPFFGTKMNYSELKSQRDKLYDSVIFALGNQVIARCNVVAKDVSITTYDLAAAGYVSRVVWESSDGSGPQKVEVQLIAMNHNDNSLTIFFVENPSLSYTNSADAREFSLDALLDLLHDIVE